MIAFSKVYETSVWGAGSGLGSSLTFAASTVCRLIEFIKVLLITCKPGIHLNFHYLVYLLLGLEKGADLMVTFLGLDPLT